MKKNHVVISAVLAIVFDLIACVCDSNLLVYEIGMGLTIASFIVYVYGLLRIGYSRNEKEPEPEETVSRARPAYAAETR